MSSLNTKHLGVALVSWDFDISLDIIYYILRGNDPCQQKKKYFIFILLLSALANRRYAQDIFQAIRDGSIEQVRVILERHPKSVDEKDRNGFTPLHIAADTGNLDIVTLLIANHADVNAQGSRGRSPLYLATWKGYTTIADVLIEKGADIFLKTEWENYPLYMAVTLDKAKGIVSAMVNNILEKGKCKNIKDIMLHIITRNGFDSLTKKMIAQGVDFYSKNEDGGTLLHSAVIGDMLDMTKELSKKGFRINIRDSLKRTPLHYATINNSADIVKHLIDRGADVNIEDIDGRVPYNIAEDWVDQRLMQMLKKVGAKPKKRKIYRLRNSNYSDSSTPLEITYLGNCGFLFSYNEIKILMDVLGTKKRGFFESTPVKAWELINDSRPPFNGIKLVFVTHPHSDHIDIEKMAAYMENNAQVQLFTTLVTRDRIAEQISPNAIPRINVVDLESGEVAQKKIHGIDVKFIGLDHGHDLKVLGFLLNIEGIKICFMTDVDLNDLGSTGIEKENIDILLTSRYNLYYQENVELVKRYINFRHVIAIHMARLEQRVMLPKCLENFPDTIFFRDRMERKIFK